MTDNAVHAVTSNQDGLYKNLDETVRKYIATRFLRPIADHTREAFGVAKDYVKSFYEKNGNKVSGNAEGFRIVLDSGCGAGESTLHLARRFPGIPVIGVDKSAVRLNKAGNEHQQQAAGTDQPANAFWIRAELLDFWRLARKKFLQATGSSNITPCSTPTPGPRKAKPADDSICTPSFLRCCP